MRTLDLFLCEEHAPAGLTAAEFATRPLLEKCLVCGAKAERWYTNEHEVLTALLKERAADRVRDEVDESR